MTAEHKPRSRMWLGVLLAPLPLVLFAVVLLALTVGLSETLLVFVLMTYAVVLVPLSAAYGLLRWRRQRSLIAYLGVTFLVTFLPAAIGWQFIPFSEDSNLTIELDDGVDQPLPLPLAGVLLALIFALAETLCMAVFWLTAIRGRELPAIQQSEQAQGETGDGKTTNAD